MWSISTQNRDILLSQWRGPIINPDSSNRAVCRHCATISAVQITASGKSLRAHRSPGPKICSHNWLHRSSLDLAGKGKLYRSPRQLLLALRRAILGKLADTPFLIELVFQPLLSHTGKVNVTHCTLATATHGHDRCSTGEGIRCPPGGHGPK